MEYSFFRLMSKNVLHVEDYNALVPIVRRHLDTFEIIGEDAFGNTLASVPEGNVFLIDIEDGNPYDLQIDEATFLAALELSGHSWIDYYDNEAFSVFDRLTEKLDHHSHIHWIQPLVLGGSCIYNNAVIMDREQHIKGHLKLLAQIEKIDPGSNIVIK